MTKNNNRYIFSDTDNSSYIFYTAVICLIFIDILFFPMQNDFIFFSLIISVIIGKYKFVISSVYDYSVALLFSICNYLLIQLTGFSHFSEKAALWTFLFLCIGVVYDLIAIFNKNDR